MAGGGSGCNRQDCNGVTAHEYENVTEQDACQWSKQRNFEHGGGTVSSAGVAFCRMHQVLSYAFGYKSTNTTRRILVPNHNAVRGDTIDDAMG